MSSRAGKMSKSTYQFNRERIAKLIIELYNVIQNQPLHKRIGLLFVLFLKGFQNDR